MNRIMKSVDKLRNVHETTYANLFNEFAPTVAEHISCSFLSTKNYLANLLILKLLIQM